MTRIAPALRALPSSARFLGLAAPKHGHGSAAPAYQIVRETAMSKSSATKKTNDSGLRGGIPGRPEPKHGKAAHK